MLYTVPEALKTPKAKLPAGMISEYVAQSVPGVQEDRFCRVVTLVFEVANAGIVIDLIGPTWGETDCRADRLASTGCGDPLLEAELSLPAMVMGDPMGVELPNSGTSGIGVSDVFAGTPNATVAAYVTVEAGVAPTVASATTS